MERDGRRSGAHTVGAGGHKLVGKTVIVDVTYTAAPGATAAGRRQFYGVVSALTNRTIVVRLSCGTALHLPPDLSVLRPAAPGAHRLASTGERVARADFVAEFTADGPYGAGALRAVETGN